MEMHGLIAEAVEIGQAENFAAIIGFYGQEDRADKVRVASHRSICSIFVPTFEEGICRAGRNHPDMS